MSDPASGRRVLGVQVGRTERLRVVEEWVTSGIRKTGHAGPVSVRPLGLVGDEQADLSVHGGLSKAVYAYPVEHYDFWSAQRRALGLEPQLPFGSLGENLTISGLLETELFVGDELKFPDCVLRVTQPRKPCFKFVAVMGDPQAARKMIQSGYCGFYLAVDEPGTLAAGQSFELVKGPRQTPLMTLFPRAWKGTAG